MKSYIKPVLEYVSLAVEERLATGSGSICTVWGTCPAGTTEVQVAPGVWRTVNFSK